MQIGAASLPIKLFFKTHKSGSALVVPSHITYADRKTIVALFILSQLDSARE